MKTKTSILIALASSAMLLMAAMPAQSVQLEEPTMDARPDPGNAPGSDTVSFDRVSVNDGFWGALYGLSDFDLYPGLHDESVY